MRSTTSKAIVTLLLSFVIILLVAMLVKSINTFSREQSGKDARDFERLTHVNILASAIKLYLAGHGSNRKIILSSNPIHICRSEIFSECGDLLDLRPLLDSYLIAIPADPKAHFGADSQYTVQFLSGKVIVSAPLAELGTVSATR